ncbi:MAG: WD40 repeat domain-containing protein [Desulfobulbaceae bacterium]|nr:WD40 repeat domain-containing protein [Desulfobulbaceae bacterium]
MAAASPKIKSQEIQKTPSTITVIKLSPTGGMLAVGYADGSVIMWNTTDNRKMWTSHGDWKLTSRLGVGQGNVYTDSIIDVAAVSKSKQGDKKNPAVLDIFFLRVDLELLIVEKDGGIRRVLADTGHLLRSHGFFWGTKKDKHLEGIIGADVNSAFEILAVVGSLTGTIHEINLSTLEKTQESTSYIVLDNWLRRLNLWPGTSFVADENLGIAKSPAASPNLLHPGEGNVKEIKYCNNGNVLIGVTDDGRLIAWTRNGKNIDQKQTYTRLGFRDGKGGYVEPGIACTGNNTLISTTPSGRYGNVQMWDVEEGELAAKFNNDDFTLLKGISVDRAGSIAVIPTRSGVTVWQLEKGEMKLMATISKALKNAKKVKNEHLQKVSISDDGTALAIADDKNVNLFDVPNLERQRLIGERNRLQLSVIHPPRKQEVQQGLRPAQ